MTTLDKLRDALSNAATAVEAAKRAKELAGDPANAAMLPEIAAMLADAIIAPPSAPRARPRKVTLDDLLSTKTQKKLVVERTMGNAAISEYAHIVNARNIADGRAPEFEGYGVEMTKAVAIQYLKDRRMYSGGRQAIKSRAKDYVLSRPQIRGIITPDKFDELKRKLRQSIDRTK